MKWLYDSVMNPDVNPLQKLPPAQRYQIMIYLSIVWTAVFCSSIGTWYWYGHLMFAHLLMVGATIVTGWTFHRASRGDLMIASLKPRTKAAKRTYRDHPRNDGTARYDDVWGG